MQKQPCPVAIQGDFPLFAVSSAADGLAAHHAELVVGAAVAAVLRTQAGANRSVGTSPDDEIAVGLPGRRLGSPCPRKLPGGHGLFFLTPNPCLLRGAAGVSDQGASSQVTQGARQIMITNPVTLLQ